MSDVPPRIPTTREFLGSDWLLGSFGAEEDEADKSAAALAEAEEKRQKLDADMHAVFRRSPAGRRVWEWLWQEAINKPSFQAQLGLDLGTAMGFAREGQNALIHLIDKRMKRHEGNV